MLISLLIMAAIIGADRLMKYWAVEVLRPAGEIVGINGIFRFSYVENTGAAFSILEDQRLILIIVPLLVSIFALYMLFFKRFKLSYRVCLSFIAAGGLSNLADRIIYGYVVDMFQFDFVSFAVFNVADIFITMGGILLIVVYIFFDKEKQLENSVKMVKRGNEETETDNK